jgi:surfeit locus 1 family protein
VGILVAAGCVRLGIWQLDRLAQRKAINATVRAQLEAPVFAIDTGGTWADSSAANALRYRRARGAGVYDFEHEVMVMARVHRGVPGVHVVTPLRITDDLAVLVERGWVPAPDGKLPAIDPAEVGDTAVVSGVFVFPSEGAAAQSADVGWPRYVTGLNVITLAAAYPYRLAPLVLRRTELPTAAPTDMRAIPLPPMTNGPHLSYALQWFSFATIALVGSVIVFRRQHRGGFTAL